MAAGLIDRALGALEVLARSGGGVALQSVADHLAIPKSGAHRLLTELSRAGFVQQDQQSGRYRLTTKLISLAFRHLAETGIVDAAQPILDRLAAEAGELVRLSITDNDHQVWIAKAQGARSGLIFDPQMGDTAQLSCMATGHAWLSCLSDEEAVRLVSMQGFGAPDSFGPNAPRTIRALLNRLAETREQGYARVAESSAPGMSAIAAAIRHPVTQIVLGTLSIGGPSSRLTGERMESLAARLLEAACELSDCCAGSQFLTSRLAMPVADRAKP